MTGRISGSCPACLWPAKGWKYPGCRAFSLWFPWVCFQREGILSGRSGSELGFIEMCENMLKVVVCVCACSQEDWRTAVPTCWAAWEGFQLLWTMQTDRAPGKRGPPAPVLIVCIEEVSSVPWSEAQGPRLCLWRDLFPVLFCLA